MTRMHILSRSITALLVAQAAGYAGRPALLRTSRAPLRDAGASVVCTATDLAPDTDLVGDGGVLKRMVRPGSGSSPAKGDAVEVHYEGTLLATGASFDSSRQRGKTFKFTLGEGKVIGGWEVGVGSMKPGELSVLTCSPQYAYGEKGIPPIIPPSATLQFEVELLSVQAAPKMASTIAEDNANAPRTPGSIQAAYERKMASKPAPKEGLDQFLEWAKGIYVFGLFSKTAERPPWYLNPLITFPAIFVFVGLLFYLVVAMDGLHRGEVPLAADDLSGFIDETPLPGAPGSTLTFDQVKSQIEATAPPPAPVPTPVPAAPVVEVPTPAAIPAVEAAAVAQ